jgi:hypothetical protein
MLYCELCSISLNHNKKTLTHIICTTLRPCTHISYHHFRRVDISSGGGGSLKDLTATGCAEGVAVAAGTSQWTSHTQPGHVEK